MSNSSDNYSEIEESLSSVQEEYLSSSSVFDQELASEEEKVSEVRITSPIMTKYEKSHVLGTRAMQISMNAPILVDVGDEIDPLEIAKLELKEKKIPFVVKRKLPDGTCEKWKISEMILPEDL